MKILSHIHSMGAFDSWIHGHQDHRPLPSVAELISALAPAWYQDEGSMEQNTGLKGPPMRGGLGSFANDHGKVVGVSRKSNRAGMMTPADQYFWANWSDLSRPVWGQLTWDWDGNNNNSNGSQAPVIQMANKCTHEYQHTHTHGHGS